MAFNQTFAKQRRSTDVAWHPQLIQILMTSEDKHRTSQLIRKDDVEEVLEQWQRYKVLKKSIAILKELNQEEIKILLQQKNRSTDRSLRVTGLWLHASQIQINPNRRRGFLRRLFRFHVEPFDAAHFAKPRHLAFGVIVRVLLDQRGHAVV